MKLLGKTSQQILNALGQYYFVCMHVVVNVLCRGLILLAGARCFYRLEDWWTYELCYEKHVRQFHKEKDVLTSEFLLGLYEGSETDTDNLEVSKVQQQQALRRM